MNNEQRVNGKIEQQAQHWLLHLYSKTIDTKTRDEFTLWLNQSELHAKAYQKVERIWRDLPLAENLTAEKKPNNATRYLTSSVNKKLHAPVKVFAMAASLIIAITSSLFWLSPGSEFAQYSTAIGEINTIELPDGSKITLAAKSQLLSHFNDQQRQVTLQAGTAYFDITTKQDLPFNVVIGNTKVTVVGTEFEIRKSEQQVRVSVTEGVVTLNNTKQTSTSKEKRLLMGEQAFTNNNGELINKVNFNYRDAAQWTQGQLVYVNEALGTIIEDVNRYRSQTIVLTDEVKDIYFTTSFAHNKSDEMIAALQSLEQLEIRYENNKVWISKKTQ